MAATPQPTLFDTRRIRWTQLAVLATALAVIVIDGLDIQLLSLVTPVILKEWGVARASFGPALSGALIGMAIGTAAGGWLGDRYGRKTMLTIAVLTFGTGTVLAGFVDDVWALAALRMLSGLGFGAATPNGAALSSEWLPLRARPRAIALLSVGIPAGGMVGASVVLALLPSLGWRGCFVACGLGTIALGIGMLLKLPESPSFLIRTNRHDRAQRLVHRMIGPDAELPTQALVADAATVERASVFTREFLRLNICAWSAFLALQIVAYGFIAWTPVFLTMAGWTLPQAVGATTAFNIAAVTSSLVTGFLLGKVDARRMLMVYYALTIVSILLVAGLLAAYPGRPTAWVAIGVTAGIAGGGGFGGGGITTLYALFTIAYPVPCRAAGIGFGITSGRMGGVVSTLTGGWLLSLAGNSSLIFFGSLLAAMLVVIAGTLGLGRMLPDAFSATAA